MKVACLQMDVQMARPEENFARAAHLVRQAMANGPDVLVLPETWNTGFFPKEEPLRFCDRDLARVKQQIGALAKEFSVNIVAGSVSNLRDGKLYNTACVFDRQGNLIASYDKTHLFSPAGEDAIYTKGDHLCAFTLDGVRCGIIICYDLRFPELTRAMCLPGLDVLFVVSQWPKSRISHLRTLTAARAIENQMFVVCCNACGTAGETVFGGSSAIIDPFGETVALAADAEEIITADCNTEVLQAIRSSIPVFRDRRPEIYQK